MDFKDKLEKAAKREAYYNYDKSYNDRRDGFIKGAEWLMRQPFSEKMTDEEIAKATAAYNGAEECYNNNADDMSYTVGLVVKAVLTHIFGKEMFEQ